MTMLRAITGQRKENNKRLPAHKSATSARTDSPQRMLETLYFLNRSKLTDSPTAALMEHHGNSKGTGTQTIGTSHSDSNTFRSPNVSDPKSREFQLLYSPYPRTSCTSMKWEQTYVIQKRTAHLLTLVLNPTSRLQMKHLGRNQVCNLHFFHVTELFLSLWFYVIYQSQLSFVTKLCSM